MAINVINKDFMKKQKMIPYKDLVDKLKKDYIKARKYQIDNFTISVAGINNSVSFGSNNIHVFDSYKQISNYVRNNDLYKDEANGFEMNIEFRVGSLIANINIASKKTNGKIKIKIVSFRIGLLTIPLDIQKEITIKEQKVMILKLNKIRSIKRFKRFYYYIIYKLYNIVNKVKEN